MRIGFLSRGVVTGALCAVVAVFILGPLLWLAVHAFATSWDYPSLLPAGLTLHWWSVVFEDAELGAAVRNSLYFAPLTVLVSAVVCLPAAYAFSRFEFPVSASSWWACSPRTRFPRWACSSRWPPCSTASTS